jgi:hypothetical protein
MESISDYLSIIIVVILSTILTISIWQFRLVKQELRIQSVHQIYSKLIEARLNLERTAAFTKMAQESPLFLERFKLVDNPDEYYIIIAFLDLFEFLHSMNKSKMIESDLWFRPEEMMKSIMEIPKFKKIWDKTKNSHEINFVKYVDSVLFRSSP